MLKSLILILIINLIYYECDTFNLDRAPLLQSCQNIDVNKCTLKSFYDEKYKLCIGCFNCPCLIETVRVEFDIDKDNIEDDSGEGHNIYPIKASPKQPADPRPTNQGPPGLFSQLSGKTTESTTKQLESEPDKQNNQPNSDNSQTTKSNSEQKASEEKQRTTLIIALICCLVGLCLLIIGFLIGFFCFRRRASLKKKKPYRQNTAVSNSIELTQQIATIQEPPKDVPETPTNADMVDPLANPELNGVYLDLDQHNDPANRLNRFPSTSSCSTPQDDKLPTYNSLFSYLSDQI